MSRRRARGLLVLAALAVTVSSACGGDQAESAGPTGITVAAASDLRPAFEQLGADFTAQTGIPVTFSFGSSGQLREQILNGAPFDLYASANVEFVDEVVAAGRGRPETRADYAEGRIVLWSPPGVRLPESVDELVDPRYRRIAIANPEHAPYGQAALEALQAVGVWPQVEGRVVYGESVSDTLRIASSGNADVAVVALSLAIADGSPFTLVPAELHEPLRQALVVTSTGATGAAAQRFADFVASPAGRAVMNRYGFVLPGEQLEADR